METVTDFIFLGSKITVDSDCSHEIKKMLAPWKKSMTNLDSVLKSWDYFANQVPPSQSYMVFPYSHVWMWEFDHKEGYAPKHWCFQTVVIENTLESPLDWKNIKPVNPKGNQAWISIGRTDAKAEAPILWPADAKSWFIGKDSDAGKDWKQEEKEKGTTEDEAVEQCHRLNRHEFEQTGT